MSTICDRIITKYTNYLHIKTSCDYKIATNTYETGDYYVSHRHQTFANKGNENTHTQYIVHKIKCKTGVSSHSSFTANCHQKCI